MAVIHVSSHEPGAALRFAGVESVHVSPTTAAAFAVVEDLIYRRVVRTVSPPLPEI